MYVPDPSCIISCVNRSLLRGVNFIYSSGRYLKFRNQMIHPKMSRLIFIAIMFTLLATATSSKVRCEGRGYDDMQIELVIGSSENKQKILYFNKNISKCPTYVDPSTRTNKDYRTARDSFTVKVDAGKVTVTRVDNPKRWGMNLKFACCGYSNTKRCNVPFRPCAHLPSISCTGFEGDEDIDLDIGRSLGIETVVQYDKVINRCPREVIRWTDTNTADTFELTVDKSKNVQIKYIERSKTNISVEEIFKKGTVRCCGYKGTKRFNEKTPSNDCSLCLSQRNWFKNEWCFYHNDKSLSHCYNFWGKSSHPNFCGGQKITKCNSCMSKTSCKACIGGVSISAI